jgi:amidase
MDEYSILELQLQMASGELSARRLVEVYLERIEQVDRQGPALNSIIGVNPDAIANAEALDVERAANKTRGPLHGIPIVLKDNIDTADQMTTTAGSLALEGSIAAQDAYLVEKLRQAGAILLAKANLSEWANFRSTHSISGWSSRGGLTRNPYALDRNPCGSSSGSAVAVAANLCAAAIGTETDGSIVCPSQTSGIVGLKPTLGLISRSGVIPIAHSQDTAGPMGRTVSDVAALLGAMTGIDPRDAATEQSRLRSLANYTQFLDPGGLKGARIGVARKFTGSDPRLDTIFETCLDVMSSQGAELIDPAEIETAGKFEKSEIEVLLYEFKANLNAYLSALGPQARVHSMQDIIDFNTQNKEHTMPFFGQERMLLAQAKGPLTQKRYLNALERNRRLARAEGIDATLHKHNLDAIVAPTGGPAWLTDLVNGDLYTGPDTSSPPAVAGYPHITVPAGYIFGLPVGLSFIGGAWQEPRLIRLAYAFEQASQVRHPPQFLPTVKLN